MKIHKWMLGFCIAIALALATPAEAVTVSGTFTTNIGAGAISSSLFVVAGEPARVQILGTFSATVRLERSGNNGVSWELVESRTSTASFEVDPQTRNLRYRVRASAYTSGTVTYDLTNVQFSQDRTVFTNVPVGSVAYGSFGSHIAPPVAGTLYTTDIVVRRKITATGVKILNGATCGTDAYVAWLFDSTGKALGNSTLAGTTCSGTDAFQTLAFTQNVLLEPGQYFVGIRINGTTDRTRFIAASTFVDAVCSATAHTSLLVGSFGSSIYAIAVPSSFTANQCPIVQVYGTNAP